MIKCHSMFSEKSGRAVVNQFVIYTDKAVVFQSYDSMIAILDKATGKLTLGVDFDYSRTTAKYLHQFIDRYIPGNLVKQIYHAPGNSFTARLRWCIKNGLIGYDERMC